jgi:p24 family protein delta-1
MQFLSALSLLVLAAVSQALRFELPAQAAQYVQPRCIRNFVNRDVLVVVTATISGTRGDGQRVNVDVPPKTSLVLMTDSGYRG